MPSEMVIATPTNRYPALATARLVVLCASPLIVLGAVWWGVNWLLLTPAVPDARTDAAAVVRFAVSDRGLPRLSAAAAQELIRQQFERMLGDGAYREQVAATVRRLPSDEQKAFQTHVIAAIKPLVMADVERFHALSGSARDAFVDERIVNYVRMSRRIQAAGVDKAVFVKAMPDQQRLLAMLVANTTEQERAAALAFAAAYAARLEEILASEALRSEFEQRVASATP